jgi:hypothetical protein
MNAYLYSSSLQPLSSPRYPICGSSPIHLQRTLHMSLYRHHAKLLRRQPTPQDRPRQTKQEPHLHPVEHLGIFHPQDLFNAPIAWNSPTNPQPSTSVDRRNAMKSVAIHLTLPANPPSLILVLIWSPPSLLYVLLACSSLWFALLYS